MKKVVYLVQINLDGLHRKVYKMKWHKDTESYFDSTGNIECQAKGSYKDGIYQLVYSDIHRAFSALNGAKMVADFLVTRLR